MGRLRSLRLGKGRFPIIEVAPRPLDEGRMANGFDKENGITCYVVSNSYGTYNDIEYFVKTKEYSSYFKSIEEVREEKLNQILDVGDSNDDLVSRDSGRGI